jgi:hypothetical protein
MDFLEGFGITLLIYAPSLFGFAGLCPIASHTTRLRDSHNGRERSSQLADGEKHF